MAIYDNNGTTDYEIGKVYDNNGTANSQIDKMYDNNGTTDSMVYNAWEEYIFNDGVFNLISGFNTVRASVSNDGDMFIASSSGNQYSMVYSKEKIDLTNVKSITVNYVSGYSWSGTNNYYTQMGVAANVPSVDASSGALSNVTKSMMVSSNNYHDISSFSGVRTLDVSELTGSYYLFFTLTSTGYASAHIKLEYIKRIEN